MSDTGWLSPTSTVKTTEGGWYTPTNAYTENGSFAWGELSNPGVDPLRFHLSFDGGDNYSYTQGSQSLTGTNTVYTHGGNDDLWGQTLTPSSFNNDNFYIKFIDSWNEGQAYYGFGLNVPTGAEIDGLEVRIKCMEYESNMEMRLDVVQIKVYYTESSTTPTVGVKYPLPPFKRP